MTVMRKKVIVSGVVQGVFFRAYTEKEARRLSLCGWVRNLPDGRVEAEIEGEEGDVKRMLSWFKSGSPLSEVHSVHEYDSETLRAEDDFLIRY